MDTNMLMQELDSVHMYDSILLRQTGKRKTNPMNLHQRLK